MTDAEPDEEFDSPFAHVPALNTGPSADAGGPGFGRGPVTPSELGGEIAELWFGPRPAV